LFGAQRGSQLSALSEGRSDTSKYRFLGGSARDSLWIPIEGGRIFRSAPGRSSGIYDHELVDAGQRIAGNGTGDKVVADFIEKAASAK
jgi:hypothetical protein